MFYVTYRNVLQQDKTLDDYRNGRKHVWPTLRLWGANGVEMYQELYDESGAFFTRYFVHSLDVWNRNPMSQEFTKMLGHLADVIDLKKSTVHVSVSLATGL